MSNLDRRFERFRRERMVGVHHDEQLVLEQLVVHEAGVRVAPNANRDVQRFLAERAEGWPIADGMTRSSTAGHRSRKA